MSEYNYPEDEFDVGEDDAPVPVGVHRAQAPRWRGWITLLAVLIIVPALAWGAVTFLGRRTGGDAGQEASQAAGGEGGQTQAPGGGQTQEPPASEQPSQEQEQPEDGSVDYNKGVTVHNGTTVSGLAGRSGDQLTNAGFTSVEVSQGVYEAAEPQTTTVYYATAEDLPTAQAVGEQLGITNIVEDAASASSNPVVVILREDFQG